MSQGLRIEFGGFVVDFRSADTAVLAELRRGFQWMIAQPGMIARAAGSVSISSSSDGHLVESEGHEPLSTLSIREAARTAQYWAIQHLVRARDDLVWLHAAAAARDGRAILFPGRRGRGKSTLVAELWSRGWTFISDDILPFDPRAGTVIPFPQAPAVREDIGYDLPDEEVPGVAKKIVTLDRPIATEPIEVVGVVLPTTDRATAKAAWVECTRGQVVLELLEGCWNRVATRDRAVADLVRLGGRVDFGRLRYASAREASDLIEAWVSDGFPDVGSGG